LNYLGFNESRKLSYNKSTLKPDEPKILFFQPDLKTAIREKSGSYLEIGSGFHYKQTGGIISLLGLYPVQEKLWEP